MLKSKTCLVALSLAVLTVAPTLALAGSFGAEVFGSFNTYSMQDVNDAIDASNSSTASNFDNLSNGISGGLGVRMLANPNWMFSATWEPLFLETKSDATNETLNLDANAFSVNGTYFFQSKNPSAKYGIGAGVGYYSLGGKDEISGPTPSSTKIEGSGPGFQFSGVAEWTMSPGFAVTGGAGYRVASIEVDKSSPKYNADYSGFTGRLGVAFYLPSASK